MGCGASSDDTARKGRGQRNTRKDIGQRRKNRKYKLDGPDQTMFAEKDWNAPEQKIEGMLWKLTKKGTDEATAEEAYYNDSGDYEVHVEFSFGPDSKIEPLDGAEMSDDADGWKKVTQIIYPNSAKRYIKGTPNGLKGSYQPKPLSDEFKQKLIDEADAKVQRELDAVKALGIDGKTSAEVLELCVAKNVKFVDPHFPPCKNSLQRSGDEEPVGEAPWRRPIDYLTEEEKKHITLINGAEPDDIDQGALGDCWFLSAIASLAEFPDKIYDIFQHPKGEAEMKKESEIGGYRVTINKGGIWQEVVVDDYLPCSGAGLPKFAKNVQDRYELWVAILEKAYAKAHGSYSTIVGGDALFGMADLSGYPTTRFDTEWKEALESRAGSNKLFKQMERYDQAGYMLCLSTPGQDTSDYNPNAGANDEGEAAKYKKAGLAQGHAYSVLTVKSFPDKDINLVRIRNPWGNATEWTGSWGDDDDKWNKHSDVAKACNFEKSADGTFWMEWDDVKDFFDGGGCCLSKFDWHDYRVKGQFSGGKSNFILEITATQDTEAFIVLSQKDKRGNAGHNYFASLLTIAEPKADAEAGKNTYEAIRHATSDVDSVCTDFCFLQGRDTAMLHKFKANSSKPYLIFLREHSQNDALDFGLGIISSNKAGSGVSFAFKEAPADCEFYSNYKTFEYSAGAEVECPYQYNPEVGTPKDMKGKTIA